MVIFRGEVQGALHQALLHACKGWNAALSQPTTSSCWCFPCALRAWVISLFSLSLPLRPYESGVRCVSAFQEYSLCGFVRGVTGYAICLLKAWKHFILMCSNSLGYLCRELRWAWISNDCTVEYLYRFGTAEKIDFWVFSVFCRRKWMFSWNTCRWMKSSAAVWTSGLPSLQIWGLQSTPAARPWTSSTLKDYPHPNVPVHTFVFHLF